MNSAIILASGSGIRFGSKKPKQFTNLKNKMIVEHSIDIFYNNNNIDEIILVCPNKWQNNLGEKYKKLKFANGGETRLESSYIGLLESDSRCINVLIHDAVRPFVSQNIINQALTYMDSFDGAIPTINSDDSLIDKKTLKYKSREKIKLVQTPQIFHYKKILEAYVKLEKESLFNDNMLKDDLSVLLKYNNNLKIKLFDGEKSNFKITHKDDLTKLTNLMK